jgi:lysophospholipase L1-like esterase
MKVAIGVLALLAISCGVAQRHGQGRGIIVLGDSVAYGAGDETGRGIERTLSRMLQRPVTNCGINGARTTDVLRALPRFPIETAAVIIISIGGNDLYGDPLARTATTLWPGHAMRRVAANVEMLVDRIRRRNRSAEIFLLGLYDPYGPSVFLDRAVNLWDSLLISRFASEPHVTIVRIADLMRSPDRISAIDHFHPSAAGYVQIAARIAPAIAR